MNNRCCLTTWVILVVSLAPVVLSAEEPNDGEETRFLEEFDESFALDWEIVHEDETQYSFSERPGELCIQTAHGGITRDNEDVIPVRNIFLLNQPIPDRTRYTVTLHVSEFQPVKRWQQVCVLVYQSEDDYVRFLVEHDGNHRRILDVRETGGKTEFGPDIAFDPDGPFWMRIQHDDDRYVLETSNDGEEFQFYNEFFWVPPLEDQPVRVGLLVCASGGRSEPVTAVLESFELTVNPSQDGR